MKYIEPDPSEKNSFVVINKLESGKFLMDNLTNMYFHGDYLVRDCTSRTPLHYIAKGMYVHGERVTALINGLCLYKQTYNRQIVSCITRGAMNSPNELQHM